MTASDTGSDPERSIFLFVALLAVNGIGLAGAGFSWHLVVMTSGLIGIAWNVCERLREAALTSATFLLAALLARSTYWYLPGLLGSILVGCLITMRTTALLPPSEPPQ